VPREPIRIVRREDGLHLVQPGTGRDVTEPMRQFSERFLSGLGDVDGFVLKSRSPCCGIRDVKVHDACGALVLTETGAGLFAAAVLRCHARVTVIDEVELLDARLRERFLDRIRSART
jgi:uncharacterized protein YbbK (DUF523 family)